MNKKMSKKLENILNSIDKDVTYLYVKWLNFKEVYAVSKEQIELLNKVSPLFFRIVEDAYWDDILLNISRLTDPSKTGSNKNLTLNTLIEEINDKEHINLYNEARKKLQKLQNKCKDIRKQRSKRIAHSDLKKLSLNEFPRVTKEIIEEILLIITEIMNLFNDYFKSTTVGYQYVTYLGSGKNLIKALENYNI